MAGTAVGDAGATALSRSTSITALYLDGKWRGGVRVQVEWLGVGGRVVTVCGCGTVCCVGCVQGRQWATLERRRCHAARPSLSCTLAVSGGEVWVCGRGGVQVGWLRVYGYAVTVCCVCDCVCRHGSGRRWRDGTFTQHAHHDAGPYQYVEGRCEGVGGVVVCVCG